MERNEATTTSVRAEYKDRIINLLKVHTRGLTEKQIAQKLGGTQQYTNKVCNDEMRKGVIVRIMKGKPPVFHNISTWVLFNGLENSEPAQWERYADAMANTLGQSKGDVLDDILSD